MVVGTVQAASIKGKLKLETIDQSESPMLIISKKNIDKQEGEKELNIKAKYKIHFKGKEKFLSPMSFEMKNFAARKKYLRFIIGKVFDENALINISFCAKYQVNLYDVY